MVVENCAWETLGWRGPVRQSEQADLRPHRLRRRHRDCPGNRENQRHSAREKHAAWGGERGRSVQGSGERREIQPDTAGPSGPLGPPPGPESPGPGRTPGGTSRTGRPLTEPGTPPRGPRGGGAAAPPRPPSCWGRRSQLISPVTTQTIASSSTGLQYRATSGTILSQQITL